MKTKPHILFIDDDQFYLDHFEKVIRDHATIDLFHGPTDFEKNISTQVIEKTDLVVVDYEFNGWTAVSNDIAGFLKNDLRYDGKIALFTLLREFGKDRSRIRKDYDYILHKKELNWPVLYQLLSGTYESSNFS